MKKRGRYNGLQTQSSQTLHMMTGRPYFKGRDPTSKERRRMPLEFRCIPVGQWPVHTILQARGLSDDDDEYLVDWKINPRSKALYEPSWVKVEHIESSLIEEWKNKTVNTARASSPSLVAIDERAAYTETAGTDSGTIILAPNQLRSSTCRYVPKLENTRSFSLSQEGDPSAVNDNGDNRLKPSFPPLDLSIFAYSALLVEHDMASQDTQSNSASSTGATRNFGNDNRQTAIAIARIKSGLQSSMQDHFPGHETFNSREAGEGTYFGRPKSVLPQPVEPPLPYSEWDPSRHYLQRINKLCFHF